MKKYFYWGLIISLVGIIAYYNINHTTGNIIVCIGGMITGFNFPSLWKKKEDKINNTFVFVLICTTILLASCSGMRRSGCPNSEFDVQRWEKNNKFKG